MPVLLADRLRTSFVVICVVIVSLYVDAVYSPRGAAGVWLLPLLGFFAFGTAFEICGMLHRKGFPVHRLVTVLGAGVVALSPGIVLIWNAMGDAMPQSIGFYPVDCPIGQMGWIAVTLVIAVSILFLTEMKDYSSASDADHVLQRLSVGGWIIAYVGGSLGMLVMIRSLGGGNWGLAALLTTIATTKSTDAGAYFTGRTLGKHKLIPRLSPGKTWEGAIGGAIIATIVAALCLAFLFPALASTETVVSSAVDTAAGTLIDTTPLPPVSLALLLGPVLAITGILGDLAQSLVKRACGAKDSGNLLPGLGGVWDVSDSLIFASLPAFLCFVAAA